MTVAGKGVVGGRGGSGGGPRGAAASAAEADLLPQMPPAPSAVSPAAAEPGGLVLADDIQQRSVGLDTLQRLIHLWRRRYFVAEDGA